MSSFRLRRLQADYDAVRLLARRHPRVEVEGVSGNPPERYRLVLHVRSAREKGELIEFADEHRLEIVLPSGYPRDSPLCRMLTPVFHPNIAPHAVCIGDHWTAGESLDLMIQRVGEMLAFQSYNTSSPLNGKAAQWAEENLDQLPLDTEEFFLDLHTAPEPTSDPETERCSNCASESPPFVTCSQAHLLCGDCIASCPTCETPLCIACGTTTCSRCTATCANCGAEPAPLRSCAMAHCICDDCSNACQECGRFLCMVCGEIACPSCAETP